MTFGYCPNCHKCVSTLIGEASFHNLTCKHCQVGYWAFCSHANPQVLTEKEFNELFEISENHEKVKLRPGKTFQTYKN